jgi:hypothetical protein
MFQKYSQVVSHVSVELETNVPEISSIIRVNPLNHGHGCFPKKILA